MKQGTILVPALLLARDNGMKSRKTAKIGAGSHRREGRCFPEF
jgi:hypothetical protein